MRAKTGQGPSRLWLLMTLVILAIFLVFVVFPLSLVLYRSVLDPASGNLTLEYFTKFFSRKYYTNTILNSFKVTVCSTLVASALGLSLA